MKLVATTCIFGSCPSIFETEAGDVVIIGKKTELTEEGLVKSKLGKDETAILLSREEFNLLIKQYLSKTKRSCFVR
jgi:hypothetical protein